MTETAEKLITVWEKYAHDVVDGRVVAGKYIRLAASKFLRDLEREDIQFRVSEAQRAINFIQRKLKHWEGSFAGKDLILEPWQQFIVAQIFGWYSLDGFRLIRTVYIQVARKNGKTSFLAAIILYHIFADRENTPQVLVCWPGFVLHVNYWPFYGHFQEACRSPCSVQHSF